MRTLLLPGMDGTGELFASCVRFLAADLQPQIVAYSRERPLGYEELLQEVPIPAAPFAILAESFSGPLGIRIAARHPDRVRAVVLVSTFVRCPAPFLARLATLLAPLMLRRPPPASVLRWALMGNDAIPSEIAEVQAVLRSVPAKTLARRLRAIVEIDVSKEFAAIEAPVLYVAGTRDRLVGPTVAEQLRGLRSDLEVCHLDAPHLVLQRRPAEAAAAISRYLLANSRFPRNRSPLK